MELASLCTLYEQEGPFATVCLESRSPTEDAEQQVRLRWDALRQVVVSVSHEVDERAREHTDRYEHGAHDQVIAGAQAPAQSNEMGAVGTLLLEHDRPATDEAVLWPYCCVSKHPLKTTQEAL